MKKICVLLAALFLLPALACGEAYTIGEVREQAEALGRWRQTYTDDYGREVAVDVAPIVPGIESVPVLTVEEIEVAEEQVFRVCERSMTTVSAEDERVVYEYMNPNTHEKMKIVLPTVGAKTFIINYEDLDTRIEEDPNVLESLTGSHFLSNEVELARAYFPDSVLRVQDCLEMAEERIGAFFPDENLKFDLMWVEVVPNSRPCYVCTLRQSLHGIPVLMCARDPVCFLLEEDVGFKLPNSWSDTESFWWGEFNRPCWDFNAYTDGGYGFQFHPLRESTQVEADVPLCGVDTVIKSLEERIKKGNIRNVHSLRLGYCCYLDEAGESVLYPIWRIECDYFYDPKEELRTYQEQEECPITSRLNYRTMIVNAQTGEFMDPIELKDKLLDCPEIITWEDVQQ